MPPIRNLTTPNDLGPAAVLRPRLSRTGNGARLIVKGNPFSFTVDSLTPCIPFLSLMGNRTPQSAAARQALLNGQDPTSTLLPGGAPPTSTAPAASNGPGTTPPAPVTTPNSGARSCDPSGPYGYTCISQTGRG